MNTTEDRLLPEYLKATSHQRNLHTYQHYRALYLKEVLSQTTFHMASRILAVSTIRGEHTHCPSFVYDLVKDFLMNELEIATMTFYMWTSREDPIESLELLMVSCAYHAKAIMTSELDPLQAYIETAYPYFTAQKYAAWMKLRAGVKFEEKKLNTIYRQLSSSGTYNNLIDTAIEEFSDAPALPLQDSRTAEAQYSEKDFKQEELALLALQSTTEIQVNGSFLESAISQQPMPMLVSETSYFPFDIGEDLLRQRSYDGGQSSYPS